MPTALPATPLDRFGVNNGVTAVLDCFRSLNCAPRLKIILKADAIVAVDSAALSYCPSKITIV